MQIKDFPNIIFDLGGVILNLDYNRTARAFSKLGLPNFQNSFAQLNQSELFDRYERGECSTAEFRNGLRKQLPSGVTDEQIDNAWNTMLLDVPAERIQLLQRLSEQKRLVLLSNTNDLHITAYKKSLLSAHGINDLSSVFVEQYYSYEVGMRKPEVRIFEYVLEAQKFKTEETLFIDDSPQHIEGAKKTGLNTYHLKATEGETILDLFG
ncbi:HAD family hydrolase [Bacteroidota bacterium]